MSKPSIQLNTQIDRVKMVHLSCSFATNRRTKCYFLGWKGAATAHTSKFVVIQLNKKHLIDFDVSQTCVSSEKKLILARIGLFGDYEGRDFTICLKYRAQLGVRFRPSGS